MSVAELIAGFQTRDIRVMLDGSDLLVEAPIDELTDIDRATIRLNKPLLFAHLLATPQLAPERLVPGGPIPEPFSWFPSTRPLIGCNFPSYPSRQPPPEILADPIPACAGCGGPIVSGYSSITDGVCWNCYTRKTPGQPFPQSE